MAKSRGDGKREKFQRFNLVTGEDDYSSQTASNPTTSRRLQSLIPSLAGDLRREKPNPLYLANLGSAVGWLFEYDRIDVVGGTASVRRFFFAATSTVLYLNVGGAWVVQNLPLASGVSSVTSLVNYPQGTVTNNLMHMSDGVTCWLFDGTTWVL